MNRFAKTNQPKLVLKKWIMVKRSKKKLIEETARFFQYKRFMN